jgi:hypothetical protein
MDAELQEVKKEIAAFYALLDKEELSKSEQYKVDNFDKELNRLQGNYNSLVTALAPATAPTHLHTVSDNNFLFVAKLS